MRRSVDSQVEVFLESRGALFTVEPLDVFGFAVAVADVVLHVGFAFEF